MAAPITVTCPNASCGHTVSVTLGESGSSPHCTHCGADLAPTLRDGLSSTAVGADHDGLATVAGGSAPTVAASPIPDAGSSPWTGDRLPERLGRYRIERRLGQGGMGTVYLAYDCDLERRVALKVPRFEEESPEAIRRFRNEARAAARLHHPHICPVYDIGEVAGIHYLTMAYIDGTTLGRALAGRAEPLPEAEAVTLARSIALAVAEAHRCGVIHRDLKPANIMLDRAGGPIIMDFGLARRTDVQSLGATRSGVLIGTPAYMPPEQARSETNAVGPRGDVYSLGVILYELLCGRCPFQGSVITILSQLLADAPPAPSTHRPGLSPRLEAICMRAMAKDPADRFVSMEEFAEALGAYQAGAAPAVVWPAPDATEVLPSELPPSVPSRPSRRGRIWLVGGSLAGVAAALGAAIYWAGLGTDGGRVRDDASVVPRQVVGSGSTAPPTREGVNPPVATEGPGGDHGAQSEATGPRPGLFEADKAVFNSIKAKLVLVPAGEFLMGATEGEPDHLPDETPQHPVRVERPFYLGSTEVTRGQYRDVIGQVPNEGQGQDDDPVLFVSWRGAAAFCNALSAREQLPPYYAIQPGRVDIPDLEGTGYRLPTEAEWEYACRAGTTTCFSFGDDVRLMPDYGWFVAIAGGRAHPVGRRRPNGWGLHDMHGNALEWCWGNFEPYDQPSEVGTSRSLQNPIRPARGGAWNHPTEWLRSAKRIKLIEFDEYNFVGFRVARTSIGR